MAFQPRTRKRVHAFRRAPDGSAFQKCNECGVSVAFALVDMHECEPNKDVKRFKGQFQRQYSTKQRFDDQPRSPFCLFMESFMKTCKTKNLIEADLKGFEAWRKMSKEERKLYVLQAENINSIHVKDLLEEVDEGLEVDDEADSAMVGKFDQFYVDYEDSEYSDSFESFDSFGFNTYES